MLPLTVQGVLEARTARDAPLLRSRLRLSPPEVPVSEVGVPRRVVLLELFARAPLGEEPPAAEK
jgi:hypothetical protein